MLEWIKALHVISVIAWMAGMLYLPRLFVYHASAEKGSVQSETFKVMERRLLRGIINPAMIGTLIFGIGMLSMGVVDWHQFWPWIKAAFVIVLFGFHGVLTRHFKAFASDSNDKPAKYFRMINEIPTVAMIVIVVMVIVKPF